MAEKEKLDIPEIAPEEPVVDTRQDDTTAENGREDKSSEEQPGGDFPSKAMGWLRKPLFWIILISVVFLGLTAGILVGFYQSKDGDAPAVQGNVVQGNAVQGKVVQGKVVQENVVQGKQAVSMPPLPTAKPGALFEGMVVDQRDEKGNIRIVFCDVALELENQKTVSAVVGDRVDLRNVIYDVLKKEPAQEGLSPEGRGRLKEKLKNELNLLLGENPVKDVYFTRYELD
jgi:flagellar basal body-associated protein FliL